MKEELLYQVYHREKSEIVTGGARIVQNPALMRST